MTGGTARKSELGTTLRRLRRERGVTGTQLASSVGVTQGTISKIERGLLVPDLDFLSKFAHTLRLTQGETAPLLRLAGVVPGGATPQSVLQYLPVDFVQADWVERRQETVAASEAKASRISIFNPLLVPGLVQTEHYARHVIEAAGERSSHRIERAVRARMRRQRVLHDRQKAVSVVVTESALLARIAPADVLADQVRHLRHLAASNQVRLGLVSQSAPLAVVPPPAFYLLDRRVHIELPHGDLWLLPRSQSCEVYERLFRQLFASAVTGNYLLTRLGQLANRLSKQ